jgi:hypothetical protein
VLLPFESQARWLLVLHAILGAATVAASTHLVVWLRGYLKGKPQRRRAVRRFAWISLTLFALTFVAGNLGYPTYKVRVRTGYLENPPAVQAAMPDAEPAAVEARYQATSRMARWFDVKEHWVALGLVLTFACLLILRRWEPTGEAAVIAPLVVAMAGTAAATAWLAALVGLITSSYRAIG